MTLISSHRRNDQLPTLMMFLSIIESIYEHGVERKCQKSAKIVPLNLSNIYLQNQFSELLEPIFQENPYKTSKLFSQNVPPGLTQWTFPMYDWKKLICKIDLIIEDEKMRQLTKVNRSWDDSKVMGNPSSFRAGPYHQLTEAIKLK